MKHVQDKTQPTDEHITEEQAIAFAKKEGIEFVDTFHIEGSTEVYTTREDAEKAAKKTGEGYNIIQTRSRK